MVFVGWGEFFLGVAVLGEDERTGGGLEVGDKLEDIGKSAGSHGGEDNLHVNDEKGGRHVRQTVFGFRLFGVWW